MANSKMFFTVVIFVEIFSLLLDLSTAAINRRSRFARNKEACAGQIDEIAVGSGSIVSPNFPQSYPNETNCRWKLTAPVGDRINITSTFFSLEFSDGCLFDHIKVYDGENELSPVLGSFCGNDPVSVSTSTNQAFIVFFSDQTYQNVGFNLSYSISTGAIRGRVVSRKPDCNSTFTGVSGYFLSPRYPLPADDNTFCTYTLMADRPDQVVQLVFTSFELEQDFDCEFDYIIIFDGSSQDDPELGRYCGHTRPPLIRSTNQTMLVQYKTDDLLQKRGFNATFQFIDPQFDPLEMAEGNADCTHLMEENTGMVTSPRFPHRYSLDKVCITVIRAPVNKYVKVTIHSFELEEETNCVFDSLTLYNGPTEDNPMVDSFCGTQLLPNTSFTSSGRTMRLKFVSDSSVTGKGFNLTYSFVTEQGTVECNMGCENDGICVQEDDGPVCECHLPYRGDKCEIAPRNCADDPCQNGGTCVDMLTYVDIYQCGCPPGLEGVHCTEQESAPELAFTKTPANQTRLKLDTQVYLDCAVNRDKADIRWKYGDDMYLQKGNVNSKRLGVVVYQGGVLEIPRLTQGNAGVYTCVAVDEDEDISHKVWVTTDIPCNLAFTQSPQNADERVDSPSHVLKCFADGAVNYEWTKDDLPIEYDERVKMLGKSFVSISNLQPTDAGKYTCQVTSEEGCVQRKSASLKIQGSSNLNAVCGRPALYKPGGQKRGRISSGWSAKPGSHPWFVLIRNPHLEESFCGGVLINEEWVLTAAHCILSRDPDTNRLLFNKQTTYLYVGTNSCFGEKGMELRVADVKVHEKYDHAAQDYDHDIALIRVHKKLVFDTKIKPVCLESLSDTEAILFRNTNAGYVAGCGKLSRRGYQPNKLVEVKVQLHPREVCDAATSQKFTDNMICAGYRQADRGDACGGDSGGGLVMETQGRQVLVGLVSWGKGCDEKGQYGYYTYVGKFFEWIHKTIARAD